MIKLVELGIRTCRWPLGQGPNFKFCGKRTKESSSYCPRHHKKAYKSRDNKFATVPIFIPRNKLRSKLR